MLKIDPRKGGRGRVAPYATTHCRVPTELKEVVDRISNEYKTALFSRSPSSATEFVTQLSDAFNEVCNPLFKDAQKLPDITQAKELASKVLRSRRSAKVSLEKLLTAIYNTEVKL